MVTPIVNVQGVEGPSHEGGTPAPSQTPLER